MNRKRWTALAAFLIAVNLAFIWGNSLLNAERSGALSGGLLAVLKEVFRIFGDRAEYVLRKLAHMSEFACLGALISWLRLLWKKNLLPGAFWGLLAACIDETIQMFVPGRFSSLTDVWIDFAGVILGIILVKTGQTLICKYQSRKKENTI